MLEYVKRRSGCEQISNGVSVYVVRKGVKFMLISYNLFSKQRIYKVNKSDLTGDRTLFALELDGGARPFLSTMDFTL